MIYILMLSVLVLLIITMQLFNKDMTAPAFLITAAFTVSLLCCCIYADVWGFNDYRLILVILAGLIGFNIFSYITYILDKNGREPASYRFEPVAVNGYKLCIYLLFQLVLYGLYIIMIMKTTGSFSLSGMSDAIGEYYNAGKSGKQVYSSGLVNIGTIINMPGIYYVIYLAVNNIICRKKNNILIYINIFVGMTGALLSGTRTTFFMYIIATVIIYIVLKQRYNGWKKNINIASVIKGVLFIMAAIIVFNMLFAIQGRTLSDITVVDLIANYIGAPVKNLELFIKDGRIKGNGFGLITFRDTYSWVNEMLGSEHFIIPKVYKYRWIDGKILGNVYTQLMPLYNDFGIPGVFISMGLLGIFCQKIYDSIKYKKSRGNIDYRLLIYSYVGFAIIFSFFSNKFFELIFARAMIYYLVGIFIFDIFFCHISIRYGTFVLNFRKKSKDGK